MHELTHLSDDDLLHAVATLVARDRETTASLLAHFAEVDARRLYLALGHPSMFAYAVEALHLSESGAYRRIHAARAARQFPQLFTLVASGKLHLAAICLMAPHFIDELFEELVAAATHQSKAQIERWLATRFAPPLLVSAVEADDRLVLGRVELPATVEAAPIEPLVPARVAPADPPAAAVAAPALTAGVVVRMVMTESTHAKLRRAQALLAHTLPGSELSQVVDRALDVLIAQLERRKFAATKRPAKPISVKSPRAAMRPRTIPARVKRAVWQRDEGRCAFVSRKGRRCSARAWLEFDHVEPVARGGTAHADTVRLLCRAHNRFEAERIFGREFMQRKRETARCAGSTRPGTSCETLDRASLEQRSPAAPDPGR